jgi:hypothetical protein
MNKFALVLIASVLSTTVGLSQPGSRPHGGTPGGGSGGKSAPAKPFSPKTFGPAYANGSTSKFANLKPNNLPATNNKTMSPKNTTKNNQFLVPNQFTKTANPVTKLAGTGGKSAAGVISPIGKTSPATIKPTVNGIHPNLPTNVSLPMNVTSVKTSYNPQTCTGQKTYCCNGKYYSVACFGSGYCGWTKSCWSAKCGCSCYWAPSCGCWCYWYQPWCCYLPMQCCDIMPPTPCNPPANGTPDPNTGDPNTGDPNTGDPNTGDPNGGGDPGTGPDDVPALSSGPNDVPGRLPDPVAPNLQMPTKQKFITPASGGR